MLITIIATSGIAIFLSLVIVAVVVSKKNKRIDQLQYEKVEAEKKRDRFKEEAQLFEQGLREISGAKNLNATRIVEAALNLEKREQEEEAEDSYNEKMVEYNEEMVETLRGIKECLEKSLKKESSVPPWVVGSKRIILPPQSKVRPKIAIQPKKEPVKICVKPKSAAAVVEDSYRRHLDLVRYSGMGKLILDQAHYDRPEQAMPSVENAIKAKVPFSSYAAYIIAEKDRTKAQWAKSMIEKPESFKIEGNGYAAYKMVHSSLARKEWAEAVIENSVDNAAAAAQAFLDGYCNIGFAKENIEKAVDQDMGLEVANMLYEKGTVDKAWHDRVSVSLVKPTVAESPDKPPVKKMKGYGIFCETFAGQFWVCGSGALIEDANSALVFETAEKASEYARKIKEQLNLSHRPCALIVAPIYEWQESGWAIQARYMDTCWLKIFERNGRDRYYWSSYNYTVFPTKKAAKDYIKSSNNDYLQSCNVVAVGDKPNLITGKHWSPVTTEQALSRQNRIPNA